MVVISKAYYDKITNKGKTVVGNSYPTAQEPAVFLPPNATRTQKPSAQIAAQKAEEDRKAEEARRALAASQQRLAEQSAALNQFSIDDNADVAKKSLFAEEAAKSSKQVTADFATLKTYVIPQKYADVKRGITPIETWNLNFDIGRLQQDQSKARAIALNDSTPENIKLADTLKKTQDDYVAKNRAAMYYTDSKGVEKARGNVITSVFANYVPQLVDQIVANIPAIALAAGAGILTGGAYTLAEVAAMTTTQLAARAAAIGLTSNVVGQGASAIAGWNQSYDVTRGASYDNLISLGVPADRAKAISADEAFWSSLIEMSDNVLDWSLLGFGKVAGAISKLGTGVAADIVAKTGKEVVVKSAMRKMVDVLAKYGVNILSEGAQEWTQEGLSIRSEKQGMSEAGIARTATAKEDLQRQNAAFQGGAQIAAITGGAALAGTNIATNLINRVNQDTGTTPRVGTVAPVNQTPVAAPVTVNEVIAPANRVTAPVNHTSQISPAEKTYYRGTTVGDARKISTGNAVWDNNLFVSKDKELASAYGKNVEIIKPKPDAKILVEGTKDFNKLGIRSRTKESMLDWATRVIVKAKSQGYDIVEFAHQGDVGTVVLNTDSVVRNVSTAVPAPTNTIIPKVAETPSEGKIAGVNTKVGTDKAIKTILTPENIKSTSEGLKSQAEIVKNYTSEKQEELKIAYERIKSKIESLNVGDKIINNSNKDVVFEVVDKTDQGIVLYSGMGQERFATIPYGTLTDSSRQIGYFLSGDYGTNAYAVVKNEAGPTTTISPTVLEKISIAKTTTLVKDSVGNQISQENSVALKNSKVKNKEGNPLVVYHGGTVVGKFDTTRGGDGSTKYGAGAYFTATKSIAQDWATERKGTVTETYLNLTNPFDDTLQEPIQNESLDKLKSKLIEYGATEKDFKRMFVANPPGETIIKGIADFIKTKLPKGESGVFGKARSITNDMLRESGYDGIIGELNDAKEYVAFNPEQIIPMMDLQLFADKTNKFAKTVLDDHDSDMEPQALVDGLSEVYEAVYNARKDNDPTTKEYAETLANSLAKEILGRTRSSFVTENDSAKEIRDWLKKIYIIPTHVAQEDLSTFKQKFKRIKFASDAMIEKGGANVLGLDVVYGELVSEYPDLFDKTQQDPTGMLRDIVTASNEITATKGKYLLSEAEINQHAPELAKSLLDSYDDVSSYSTDEEKIAAKNRRSDALEQEFFGRKISQMDSQMLKKKFEVARTKLLARFNREKAEIRSLAKDRQVVALDRLSKKYDAKIDSLNSMLDSEKYTNFWKNELDKKELRGRIDTLRADKNATIDQMQKAFSEKLKTTKQQATLNKATAISKVKGIYAANKKAAQVRLAERKEINKKLSDLRKVDMKHMRPEYQKRIQAIFDAFDITAKKHTTTKLNALNALQKYISDNPDHSIPEYKLKELAMLSKKTASQITKEEFNSIHDAVMHLVTLEQLKDQLIMNGKYRANSEAVAEGVTNVTKGRRVTTDPLVVDTSKPEFANKLFSKPMEFIDNHFTPETLVLKSDQKKNGITKQIVFDAMYAGYSNVLDFKQQADKIFSPFLKGLGGDLRNWSRSVNKNLKSSELVEVPISKQANQTVQKIRVTKAERIYLYLGSFDTDIRRSMLKGGISFKNNLSQIIHLTESDIDTINSSLTADEKKFSDLANQYFKWAGVKLNEVFLKLNGYELVQSDKNYLPKETHPDTIQRDFLKMKNKSINASIEGMGFLKERTKTSNAVVVDDIFRVIIGHMEEASAYYGYAEPLRNAKMFLGDPNLKNAYRKVGMNNVLQQLNKYVADIEEKSIDMDFVEKLSYSMQSKFSTAALGGNVFTILKQPSSYILEANEIPAQYLLKAIATKSTLDEIRKYSPILTDRIDGNVSMEMGDIGKIARVRELFGNYRDWPQKLTKGISAADRMIVGKTWNAVKMMFKAENPSITQEELMTKTARKVEEVIRHTNSAATIHDRSQIGRSRNFFTKAMTIFTSQTNIMFNSATQAVLELNYSDHKVKDFATATKKLATIYILANMYEQSIDRLRKKATGQDDQPWNVIQDWIGGMLDGIYFVGKAVKVYQSRVEYGKYFGYDFSIPPLQIAEQGINFAVDVATMIEQRATQEVYKSGEKKGSIKWLQTLNALKNETFSIVARLNGLPYDNLVKLFDIVTNKQ